MSDPMRDAIRGAIAEMIDEAPAPRPYRRPAAWVPARRRGPVVAFAAFALVILLIGVTSLLRGPAPDDTPLLDVPETDELGPLLLPSETLDLRLIEARWQSYVPAAWLHYASSSDFGRVVTITTSPWPVEDEQRDRALESIQSAYPEAQVTQSTEEGVDLFVVDDPETGFVGALVIGSDGMLIQTVGAGLARSELVTFAESLDAVTDRELADTAAHQITWDVLVDVWPADRIGEVESIEGVARVTRKPLVPRLDLDTAVRNGGASAAVETTMETMKEAGGDGTTPASEEIVEHVDVYLTLEPDADVEAVIERIPDPIGLSAAVAPAHALKRAEEYLAHVAEHGERLDERPIYQAPLGPAPSFETNSLGSEQPLSPVSDASVLIDRHQLVGVPGTTPADGPVVSIGELAGGESLALVFAGSKDYLESDGNGGSGGDFSHIQFGSVGGSYGSESPLGTIRLRVPLDTSVVQVVLPDGTSYWQRPAGGYGLMAIDRRILEADTPFDVVGLDAQGNEIGRWPANL